MCDYLHEHGTCRGCGECDRPAQEQELVECECCHRKVQAVEMIRDWEGTLWDICDECVGTAVTRKLAESFTSAADPHVELLARRCMALLEELDTEKHESTYWRNLASERLDDLTRYWAEHGIKATV